jgi:hypothetical protein
MITKQGEVFLSPSWLPPFIHGTYNLVGSLANQEDSHGQDLLQASVVGNIDQNEICE